MENNTLLPENTKVSLISYEKFLQLDFDEKMGLGWGYRLSHSQSPSGLFQKDITIPDIFNSSIKWTITSGEESSHYGPVVDGQNTRIPHNDYRLQGTWDSKTYHGKYEIYLSVSENLIAITEKRRQQLIETKDSKIPKKLKDIIAKLNTEYVCVSYECVTGGSNYRKTIMTKDFEIKWNNNLKTYGVWFEQLFLYPNDLERLLDNGKLCDQSVKITQHTTFRFENIYMYSEAEMSKKPKDYENSWNR